MQQENSSVFFFASSEQGPKFGLIFAYCTLLFTPMIGEKGDAEAGHVVCVIQSSPLVRSAFCPKKIDHTSGLTLYPGY